MRIKAGFSWAVVLTFAFVLAAEYKNAPDRSADFRDAAASEQLQKSVFTDQASNSEIPSPQPAGVITSNTPEPQGAADGPLMRLAEVSFNGNKIAIKGRAFSGRSGIAGIYHAFTATKDPYENYRAETYTFMPASDGEYDSSSETFSLKLPCKGGNLTLKAVDSSNNASYLRLSLLVNRKSTMHVVYLSASAMGLEKTEFENFKLYSSPAVPMAARVKVKEKLLNLRGLADAYFAFKTYDPQAIVLYTSEAEDFNTFSNFRGVLEDGIFSFPVKADDLSEVSEYNSTIDDWIPHELGDHTTRSYSPTGGDKIRWLSEGLGDYLGFIYLNRYFPDLKAQPFVGRVELYADDPPKKVNLLDGKWGAEYYLCSTAFFLNTASRHGTEAFKKLFTRLNDYPKDLLNESAARKILGEITGEDITAALTGASTGKAIAMIQQDAPR